MNMGNGGNDVVWISYGDPAFDFGGNWNTTSDLKISNTPGATVSLNFTGCGLSWIGDILGDLPGNASSCTYVIDGGEPISVTLNGHDFQDTTTIYDVIFFTTPVLPPGSHTINVTYNGNYNTPLTIAYVLVTNTTLVGPTPPIPPPPLPPPPPPPTSSPSPSSSTSSSTSSSAQTSSNSHPVGSIAGGIVGGIVIITIITIILILRRRNRTLGDSDSETSLSTLFSRPLTSGDDTPQNSTATCTTSQQSSAPDSSGLHRAPRNRLAQNVEAPPPNYDLGS
ncbi:hypothetical protein H0H92_010573 [Tricholoma furcatifolium]|nr:hypothetical protein H0H92_010573 [Tricholoma furcatifolium]